MQQNPPFVNRHPFQAQPASLYPSAPAVPSFGLPIPSSAQTTHPIAPLPSASSHSPSNKRLKPIPTSTTGSNPTSTTKRKNNLLGLTPRASDSQRASDSEDDANEESTFSNANVENPSLLQVEYKGTTSTLKTAEEIKAWIAERKKRWPTRARVEEKIKEDGKRKMELAEARKKVLESQREAAAKRRAEVEERAAKATQKKPKLEQSKVEGEGVKDEEGTAKTGKQKATAARRQRKRNHRAKREAGASPPIAQPTTEGMSGLAQRPEHQPDPQLETSSSKVKAIISPPSTDVVSSEIKVKVEPAPPPIVDQALAARRSRIEALRKQLEEEEAEMMRAEQPAETQGHSPHEPNSADQRHVEAEALPDVEIKERIKTEGLEVPTVPVAAIPSQPRTTAGAPPHVKAEEFVPIATDEPNDDASEATPAPAYSHPSPPTITSNSTGLSNIDIKFEINNANNENHKADSDLDSDSDSSSVLSPSSSSSTLSSSSLSSSPAPLEKEKETQIKHRTPYNPPENPTQPPSPGSQPAPRPPKQCHHYARTGRCRFLARGTCPYAHGALEPLQDARASVDRSVNSFAGAGAGGIRELGKAKGREREKEKKRKSLHAALVEKEKEREDEVVLGWVGRLGAEGAFS